MSIFTEYRLQAQVSQETEHTSGHGCTPAS